MKTKLTIVVATVGNRTALGNRGTQLIKLHLRELKTSSLKE
jgi:hypothetical protein